MLSIVTRGYGANSTAVLFRGFSNATAIYVGSATMGSGIGGASINQPDTAPISVFIDDQNFTSKYLSNTISLNRDATTRDTATLKLLFDSQRVDVGSPWDLGNPWGDGVYPFAPQEITTVEAEYPVPGQRILIRRFNSTILFRGFIESVDAEIINGTTKCSLTVTCADYSQIFDRRAVGGVYRASAFPTIGDVAKNILETCCGDLGITFFDTDASQTALGDDQVFFWVTVTEAMQALALIARANLRLDENLEFRFFTLSDGFFTGLGGFDESNATFMSMKMTRSRAPYANEVVAKSSKALAAIWIDTLTAEENQTKFQTQWPIDSDIRLFVNGIEEGISLGPQLGFSWYYAAGSPFIFRHPSASPLLGGESVQPKYLTPYASVAIQKDQEQIDTGGGSPWTLSAPWADGVYPFRDTPRGEFATIIEAQSAQTIRELASIASAALDRGLSEPYQLTVITQEEGYVPGRLVHVSAPRLGVEDDFVIDSIRVTTQGQGVLMSEIALSNAEYQGAQSSTKLFGNIVKSTRQGSVFNTQTIAFTWDDFDTEHRFTPDESLKYAPTVPGETVETTWFSQMIADRTKTQPISQNSKIAWITISGLISSIVSLPGYVGVSLGIRKNEVSLVPDGSGDPHFTGPPEGVYISTPAETGVYVPFSQKIWLGLTDDQLSVGDVLKVFPLFITRFTAFKNFTVEFTTY